MNTPKSDILIFDEKMWEERDYWLKRLSREIGVSNLRLDHPRVPGYAGITDSLSLDIGDSLYLSLLKLTADGPFLLFTTLMAALKICLHRYSGDTTIVVGTPALKNDDPDQKPNALAIADEVDGDLSFKQFLLNTRQSLLDAYARQLYPFKLLIKDLGLTPEESRCPIFDVAIALKDIHAEMAEVNNDLTLVFAKGADRISGNVSYKRNLFEQESIRRFTGCFLNILRSGLERIDSPIRDLELLTASERRQILVEWNQTYAEYDRDKCVQSLFESQVEKTPDAVAISFDGKQLTYTGLNRRANRLAHHLRAIGVGPEILVGVCLKRSDDMVLSILAILKAGGAHLPIDPTYPAQRISFMLDDAKVRILLTQQHLLNSVPEGVEVFCLDSDWGKISNNSDQNPNFETASENLAYVIYTSGSTGLPKGVGVTHRSLINLVRWHQLTYNVEASDRATQLAALGFDASVWEVWPYLTAGASVHIVDGDTRMSASKLIAWERERQITMSFIPTPMFEAMLAEHAIRELKLKALLTGGDKLHKAAGEGLNLNPINHYGPTESTVVATCAKIPARLEEGATPPIGKPIANTQVYILDRYLSPVPIGVTGELYIGGESLARGYLNRPEVTAEKFTPNPFAEHRGSRLYNTGDLARLLLDGDVEFIGRNDDQVKIRGYRVELGEVEAALIEHAHVQEAIVIAREAAPGDKRLVAYLVAGREHMLQLDDLRGFIKERLPEYMIPTAFVILDSLPLSPNGKVDRAALPEPLQLAAGVDEGYTSPRTPIEEVLAYIWAEVLNVGRVGVHHDFFALGGNSLLATQAVSRISNVLQVDVPLTKMFEDPTIARLAEVVELKLRGGADVQLPPIRRASRTGPLPLSFAQQRLWFLDQLEPASPLYNVAAAVRISGRVDMEALEKSLSEIIRRHEVLRTSFSEVEGQPVQIVEPAGAFRLQVKDLTDLPEAEREPQAQRYATEEALRPFNLKEVPLLRASALRLKEDEHLVVLVMHHIASDGWSVGVVIREVAMLYEAFTRGEPSPLPELPIQYADFAVWQREWLRGEVLDTQLDYWRRQLDGVPPVLELPTDRPRPAIQTYNGTFIPFDLPKGLTEGLKALSRREGTTLFMTLLAAFQVLLQRYTRQDDIAVGSPIANRRRSEIEGLIGFFVNTLVLRSDLSGDPSFRDVLSRVREVALGAYAHQDLPFEVLVEQLQPGRSLSHSPLFQVFFALQNAPRETLKLPGLRLTARDVSSGTAKFDLLMSMLETDRGLSGILEYNTDLFNEQTVARILGHFQALLEALVSTPEAPIWALPLLTGAERKQLLFAWNDTASQYPAEKTVSLLFEEQVRRTPNAEAVTFRGEVLTYGAINRRANQLALHLRSLGVGPESLIGICLQRSIEMMVAVLGVLKAGGAYVPLDPSYPKERLSYMMENSSVAVLLTQQRLLGVLPEHQARPVCLDSSWDVISGHRDDDLESLTSADNLAYVTYTSGSTGRPKGIGMVQRPLLNLLNWMIETTHLPEGARTVQFASLSFDVSFQDIFSTWLSGGTLVLISEDERRDIAGLARLLTERGVNRIFLPAVALQQLAEGFCAEPEVTTDLRKVIAGSEQLVITQAIMRFFSEAKQCSLHNEYGPSEAHVVTAYALPQNPTEWPGRPPVGRPIYNTRIYLLDRNLEPVPVGVAGELFIGGVCLARGYIGSPDITAERFVPDHFSGTPGARLYRTGDLARYLPEGNIEFLGRMDDQIKIRGFRVELGEVETVLGQHSGVKEAVVTTREHAAGDKRLIAYVGVGRDHPPTVTELRNFLLEKLPEYMVPSHFILLESLPLNANGKVDRRALPPPDQARPELEQSYLAPQTPLQEVVAGVWSEFLGVERVGIKDNFFELGGHSLLATRVISRLRETFQIELPLRALFESPTVAGLSARMAQTEQRPGDLNKIAQILKELETISEDEAKRMLNDKRSSVVIDR